MKPDITLIQPHSTFLLNEAVFPPLGILYLSAYLKQNGLTVQCLDLGIGHTKEMAESDVVGISFTTPQKADAYDMVKYFAGKGKLCIAGGAHPTHAGRECRENGFHVTIAGDGEVSLLNVLNSYHQNFDAEDKIEMPDIDELPFPDREALPVMDYKYEIDGYRAAVIMTSRGCPYHCSFCAKTTKDFRMQSAKRTLDEILYINDRYKYRAFMIFDDLFIANKQRLIELTKNLKDRKFIFRCFVRSNLITNEIAVLMKEMGVVEVGLGVESGSDKVLSLNMKGTTKDVNSRAVQILRDNGIRVKAFIIVGLPGENHVTIQETANWIDANQPDDIDVSIFQPLPGSTIFANPDKFGVSYQYNGRPTWYKGAPGKYICNVETAELSRSDILHYRNTLEIKYKNKELLR